jgi:hypothetical protein
VSLPTPTPFRTESSPGRSTRSAPGRRAARPLLVERSREARRVGRRWGGVARRMRRRNAQGLDIPSRVCLNTGFALRSSEFAGEPARAPFASRPGCFSSARGSTARSSWRRYGPRMRHVRSNSARARVSPPLAASVVSRAPRVSLRSPLDAPRRGRRHHGAGIHPDWPPGPHKLATRTPFEVGGAPSQALA